jgi:hypothetical protein
MAVDGMLKSLTVCRMRLLTAINAYILLSVSVRLIDNIFERMTRRNKGVLEQLQAELTEITLRMVLENNLPVSIATKFEKSSETRTS